MRGAAILWPRVDLGAVEGHLRSVAGWSALPRLFVELLSGVTVYRYVAGEPSPLTVAALDGLVTLALVLALPGIRALWRSRRRAELGLLAGVLAALAALYLVSGTMPLEPHNERFAMFLVVPSCVALALLTDAAWPRGASPGVCLSSAVLLSGFAVAFLGVLLRTGGDSHRTFRTGPVEPKQAALDAIRALTLPGEKVSLLADDWWDEWPLRYLAARDLHLAVQRVGDVRDLPGALSVEGVHTFAVGFADGIFQGAFPSATPVALNDYAGRPVLLVWDLGRR